MAEITLKINHRGYSMYCDEGQEERLNELASYVDSRLRDIAAAGAATNESHLLVLTSLVLADEVFDMREELSLLREKLQSKTGVQHSHTESAGNSEEEMIVEAIEYLANRIERISSRLTISGQGERMQERAA